MGSIIRKNDKISCVDGILIIIRGENESLIPLEHILRIIREDIL